MKSSPRSNKPSFRPSSSSYDKRKDLTISTKPQPPKPIPDLPKEKVILNNNTLVPLQ